MPENLPNDYGDAAAEYAAVRTRAGLVDRRDWGVVELTGRDRVPFLHALLSNDVKSLAPGQGCAATLLDVHGKIQALLEVLALEDRLLLLLPPGTAPRMLEALDHYLFAETVAVPDLSAESALLLVAGPEAPALVERVAGARPGEAAWSHVAGALDGVALRLVRGAGGAGRGEGGGGGGAGAGKGGRPRARYAPRRGGAPRRRDGVRVAPHRDRHAAARARRGRHRAAARDPPRGP